MTGTVLIGAPAPGIRQLTISRPARRNALDRASYAALVNALAQAATDDTVRVLVLTGANGCFTSGNDLSDFQDVKTPVDTTEHPSAGMTFLKALMAFPKPVIAAVEGFAIGIGTTLLLHCDLAYAGRGAQFRLPFVPLGLCPEGASSYLLPLVAGPKRAAELLLLGEAFTAGTAADAGLVNEVTDDAQALPLALVKAKAIAALPAQSLATTKQLLGRGIARAVAETLEAELVLFHALRRGPEAQKAFATFFAK